MQRNFDDWFNTFRASINISRCYVDFSSSYKDKDMEVLNVEMHILDVLVNADNPEEKFRFIANEYPCCLKVIAMLMDMSDYEIYFMNENGTLSHNFKDTEQYIIFMRSTGIFKMLQKHVISNLHDYIAGIKAGLNLNGRKNRGGHQMENLVESFLKKAGVEYDPQMYIEDIEHEYHINLSPISAGKTSTKRFDFVVRTEKFIYAIETNFYTSGGSKLNETARSYKMLAEESRYIERFRFMWITDGGGWESAKHNLEETFNAMTHIYNIADMEEGIFIRLFKKDTHN